MGRVQQPETSPFDRIAALEARVDTLERARRAGNTSIDGGRLVVSSGGVVVTEMGVLAANGISPAQNGFRINDASGAPVADSLRLIQVMKSLGFGISGGGTATTTSYGVLSGSAVTFNLAQRSRIYYIIKAVGVSNVNYGFCDPYIDGTTQYAAALVFGAGTQVATSGWALSTVLDSGSHTLDLRIALASGTGSFQVIGANTDVYLLGAV